MVDDRQAIGPAELDPQPTFSVIVPCYNVAETVTETIASVSAQTFGDFEIIAVDNNATDETPIVLRRLAEREPRLRIVQEPLQGLACARNGGIRAARGRFIAFLDADDLIDADYLEQHLLNLADPAIAVSFSRIRHITHDGRPAGTETRPKLHGLSAVDLLLANPCTSLIAVRRCVFEYIGVFDGTLKRVEDQEWLFRVAAAGLTLRGIDRVLASYRLTPGGLSFDLDAMLAAHGQMLDAARRIAPDIVARHGRRSRGAMLRYCAQRAVHHRKHPAVARGYLWRMLGTAPDLLIVEPLATLKVAATALLPGLLQLRNILRPGKSAPKNSGLESEPSVTTSRSARVAV